jgi:hypothetical protein
MRMRVRSQLEKRFNCGFPRCKHRGRSAFEIFFFFAFLQVLEYK